MPESKLLSMTGIAKRFGGTIALVNVNLELDRGRAHALVGQNGAGKSTLIKILSGALRRDAGNMYLAGASVDFGSPAEAIQNRIASVYQEVNLLEGLTVAENVMLGHEPVQAGRINWPEMYLRTEEILDRLTLRIDPRAVMGTLSIANRQMVAIARGISLDARIVILDEPTSSLSSPEVYLLYEVINRLKLQGVATIFISHRFDELYAACDDVTVMRDGRDVARGPLSDFSRLELTQLMLGRAFSGEGVAVPSETKAAAQPPFLEITNLRSRARLAGVSFTIGRGEIIGLAGLLGAGRTETARALFGVEAIRDGEMSLDGMFYAPRSPRDAIIAGLGLVAEDRKNEGIFSQLSVAENLIMAALPAISWFGVRNWRRESELAEKFIKTLSIRAGAGQKMRSLSGGNQQKVLLARWLCRPTRLLILDEPTRGVDVMVKAEIRSLIANLTAHGVSVLWISSELEELASVCHRIVVLRDGKSIGEFAPRDKAAILAAMAGDSKQRDTATPSRLIANGHSRRSDAARTPAAANRAAPAPIKSSWPEELLARFADYGPLVALLALVLLSGAVIHRFATLTTLTLVLLQVAPTIIVGVGMTLVLATRGIDLSVGSTMAVASAVAASVIGHGAWAAVLAGLATAILVGCINGCLVAKYRAEPFVVTLAMLLAGRGLAQVISNEGQVVPFSNAAFSWLGRGACLGVPIPFLWVVAVLVATAFIMYCTNLGCYIVAIGGNETAAHLSGVPVVAARFSTYVICALFAGLAGLLETARLGATDPSNFGAGMEFAAIFAAVIGGTPLTGGRGRVGGTVIGALILGVIDVSFNMLLIPFAWALLARSIIILSAVALQAPQDR